MTTETTTTTPSSETGAEIKARVLAELGALRPQVEAAVAAGKPNADRAARAVAHLELASPSWYLSMRDGAKDAAKPWISRGLDSAAALLRHLVAEELRAETEAAS